jgi:hypothetical protein
MDVEAAGRVSDVTTFADAAAVVGIVDLLGALDELCRRPRFQQDCLG